MKLVEEGSSVIHVTPGAFHNPPYGKSYDYTRSWKRYTTSQRSSKQISECEKHSYDREFQRTNAEFTVTVLMCMHCGYVKVEREEMEYTNSERNYNYMAAHGVPVEEWKASRGRR